MEDIDMDAHRETQTRLWKIKEPVNRLREQVDDVLDVFEAQEDVHIIDLDEWETLAYDLRFNLEHSLNILNICATSRHLPEDMRVKRSPAFDIDGCREGLEKSKTAMDGISRILKGLGKEGAEVEKEIRGSFETAFNKMSEEIDRMSTGDD